jgi:nitrogen fixation NifU-like protein
MDFYAEELISHYEHPHNKGVISNSDSKFHEYNPTCGDDITIYLKIKNDIIEDVKFDGNGCSISIASASMLTDFVKGKKLSEIEKMDFKTLKELINIDPGPARLKCATLSLKTLKGAVFLYEHKPMDQNTKNM